MDRHFTSTVYLFHEGKALLHFHPKLNRWLPPGGHIEANETPDEAARRETLEETGLEIEWICQDSITIDSSTSKSLPRPFLCMIEDIPPYKETPAHQHIDFIFLAQPRDSDQLENLSREFKWFTQSELAAIADDLFDDTKEILLHLFKITTDDGGAPLSELFPPQPFSYLDHRKM